MSNTVARRLGELLKLYNMIISNCFIKKDDPVVMQIKRINAISQNTLLMLDALSQHAPDVAQVLIC